MIEACRRGPDSARVDAVDVYDARPSELAMRRGARRVFGAADGVTRYAELFVRPNSASNSRRSAASTSAMVASMPRSARLVTP